MDLLRSALILLLFVAPALGGEGAEKREPGAVPPPRGPNREDPLQLPRLQDGGASLPGDLVLFASSAPLPVLSQHGMEVIERLGSGDSTDARGTDPMPHLDTLRARSGAAGTDQHRLTLLLGSIAKVPPERLDHFIDKTQGLQYAVFRPKGEEKAYRVAYILPLRNFEDLVSTWKQNRVARHMVRELPNDVVQMQYPPDRLCCLKSFPGGGVVFAETPEIIQKAIVTLSEMPTEALQKGPDIRVWFDPAKLPSTRKIRRRGPGRTPSRRKKMGVWSSTGLPAYAQALSQFPLALAQSMGDFSAQLRLCTIDLYMTHSGAVLDARALPKKESTIANLITTAPARPGSPALLHAMPRQAIVSLVLPNGPELVPALRPMLLDLMSGVQSKKRTRSKEKVLVVPLTAKKIGEIAAGPVMVSYVEGKLRGLNLLIAFEARTEALGHSLQQELTPHLGYNGAVDLEEKTVMIALGFEHKQLLKELKHAVANQEKRFHSREPITGFFQAKPYEPYRNIGVAYAYPVDLCKSLIGEMLIQVQRYAAPMDQLERIIRPIFDKVPSSRIPLVVGVGTDGKALRLYAGLPLGAGMDIARVLNEYTNRMSQQSRNIPEQVLRGWLQALLANRLKQKLSADKQKALQEAMKNRPQSQGVVPQIPFPEIKKDGHDHKTHSH